MDGIARYFVSNWPGPLIANPNHIQKEASLGSLPPLPHAPISLVYYHNGLQAIFRFLVSHFQTQIAKLRQVNCERTKIGHIEDMSGAEHSRQLTHMVTLPLERQPTKLC